MTQQVRTRKQETIAYSSNNKVSENLSRGMVYRELYLKLSGQLTATVGNNVYANVLRGDEWAVVKRIDVIANGTDVIKSFSGPNLRMLNYLWYGVPPKRSVALGDGTANPAFASTLVIPFWMPRSVRPIDTALDSRELSSLTVEITWGTHTDINASATGFTTSPTVELASLESFNVTGPFSQWRMFEIEKEVTSTTNRFRIELPVGGVYRNFLISATDAGADDNAVVNNVKLVSGSTVFDNLPADILQDVQHLRQGITRGFSGTAYDDVFMGDNNDMEGYYLLDRVTDGFLTEGLDTLGFSELFLEFDVTVGGGTTNLTVIPSEIIPIRGNAKG